MPAALGRQHGLKEPTRKLTARRSATRGKPILEEQPRRKPRNQNGINYERNKKSNDGYSDDRAELTFDKASDQALVAGFVAISMKNMVQCRAGSQNQEEEQLQNEERGQNFFNSLAKTFPALPV